MDPSGNKGKPAMMSRTFRKKGPRLSGGGFPASEWYVPMKLQPRTKGGIEEPHLL